jgi:hypothetical protein
LGFGAHWNVKPGSAAEFYDQNLDLQMDALNKAGCERVFTDHGVSGISVNRTGLNKYSLEKIRMKIALGFSIVLILLLGACSSKILKTTSIPSITKDSVGVVYYLPKALIPITISLEDGVPKSSDDGATKPGGNGNNPVQTTTNNININTGSEKPGASQKPEADKKPVIPSDVGSLKIQKDQYYKVTIGESKLVADTSQPFFLNYNPELVTDDVLAIGVGPNQLLQTTNSKSTDQSGQIAVILARIAIDVFRLTAVFDFRTHKKETQTPSTIACADLKDIKVNTYLDVSAKNEEAFSKKKLEDKLKNTPIRIEVTNNSCDTDLCRNPVFPSKESANKLPKDADDTGVLFRALRSYNLTVSIDPANMPDGKKWCEDITIPTEINEVNIMVPNDGPVYSVDVSRAAFVSKTTNLTIVDGMLAKIDLDKPSSLVSFVRIPLDILEAIIAVPSDLLTLRLKKIQDEGALTKAQGDLLLNEIARLKNEKALEQQRNSQGATQ